MKDNWCKILYIYIVYDFRLVPWKTIYIYMCILFMILDWFPGRPLLVWASPCTQTLRALQSRTSPETLYPHSGTCTVCMISPYINVLQDTFVPEKSDEKVSQLSLSKSLFISWKFTPTIEDYFGYGTDLLTD